MSLNHRALMRPNPLGVSDMSPRSKRSVVDRRDRVGLKESGDPTVRRLPGDSPKTSLVPTTSCASMALFNRDCESICAQQREKGSPLEKPPVPFAPTVEVALLTGSNADFFDMLQHSAIPVESSSSHSHSHSRSLGHSLGGSRRTIAYDGAASIEPLRNPSSFAVVKFQAPRHKSYVGMPVLELPQPDTYDIREDMDNSASREVDVLKNLFQLYDTVPPKGYLDFSEVCGLLDCLGIEMDSFVEVEFFHAIDASNNGKVLFESFQGVYTRYMREKRFNAYHSPVKISCALAAHMGTGTDEVVAVWTKHAFDMARELGPEEVIKVLEDLGLTHSLAEVNECMEEFDFDGNGKLSLPEFVSLFVSSQKTEEEMRFEEWMGELRTVIASANLKSGGEFRSDEQVKEDAQMRLQHWYRTVYIWPLFFYTLIQLTVPLFCASFNKGRAYADSTAPYRAAALALVALDVVWYYSMYIKVVTPHDDFMLPRDDRISAYLRSTSFLFDVFVALPIDVIAGVGGGSLFLHPLLRLNKFAVLVQHQDYFRGCWSALLGPKWRIANGLYWWALVAHFFACLFNTIALHAGDEKTRVVLTVAGYSDLSAWTRYLQSYSYAVNTMAGLNRGYFPSHDLHVALSLAVAVAGVFVYSIIIAVVTSSLLLRGHQAKFEAGQQDVKEVLGPEIAAGRLPKSFVAEALAYHSYVFRTTGKLRADDDLLADLPPQLQVALDLVTGRNTIGTVPMIQDVAEDDGIVYALQQCLTQSIMPPDTVVFEEGSSGHEMYFIQNGECVVLDESGVQLYVLQAGDIFGEISLLTDVSRTATVKTSHFTTLFVLERCDFNLVMNQFPQLLKEVVRKARERLTELRRRVDHRKVSAKPLQSSMQAQSYAPNDSRSSSTRQNPLAIASPSDTDTASRRSRNLSVDDGFTDISPQPSHGSPAERGAEDAFDWIRRVDEDKSANGRDRSRRSEAKKPAQSPLINRLRRSYESGEGGGGGVLPSPFEQRTGSRSVSSNELIEDLRRASHGLPASQAIRWAGLQQSTHLTVPSRPA